MDSSIRIKKRKGGDEIEDIPTPKRPAPTASPNAFAPSKASPSPPNSHKSAHTKHHRRETTHTSDSEDEPQHKRTNDDSAKKRKHGRKDATVASEQKKTARRETRINAKAEAFLALWSSGFAAVVSKIPSKFLNSHQGRYNELFTEVQDLLESRRNKKIAKEFERCELALSLLPATPERDKALSGLVSPTKQANDDESSDYSGSDHSSQRPSTNSSFVADDDDAASNDSIIPNAVDPKTLHKFFRQLWRISRKSCSSSDELDTIMNRFEGALRLLLAACDLLPSSEGANDDDDDESSSHTPLRASKEPEEESESVQLDEGAGSENDEDLQNLRQALLASQEDAEKKRLADESEEDAELQMALRMSLASAPSSTPPPLDTSDVESKATEKTQSQALASDDESSDSGYAKDRSKSTSSLGSSSKPKSIEASPASTKNATPTKKEIIEEDEEDDESQDAKSNRNGVPPKPLASNKLDALTGRSSGRPWTPEEDKLLLDSVRALRGNKGGYWADVGRLFPTRSDTSVKQHFAFLEKKMAAATDLYAAPAKRGPGRPRKDSQPTAAPIKRGPGRPRKDSSPDEDDDDDDEDDDEDDEDEESDEEDEESGGDEDEESEEVFEDGSASQVTSAASLLHRPSPRGSSPRVSSPRVSSPRTSASSRSLPARKKPTNITATAPSINDSPAPKVPTIVTYGAFKIYDEAPAVAPIPRVLYMSMIAGPPPSTTASPPAANPKLASPPQKPILPENSAQSLIIGDEWDHLF